MKTTLSKAKHVVKKAARKEASMVDAVVEKVKKYISEEGGEFNTETVIKYTALAVVVIYGLSKSSWLRGMLLPAIATLVTERLIGYKVDEKEVATA